MKLDALAARSITAPEDYQQQIQLGREIADVLRKNVVQAVKADDPEKSDTWSEACYYPTWNPINPMVVGVRITVDTELGDNETIKQPQPKRSDRSIRKREKGSPHKFVLSPTFSPTI